MTVEAVAVVLVSTFNRGRCKRCGVPVVWYQTLGGSWLPFDGTPSVQRLRRVEDVVERPMVGELPRASMHWRTCAGHALDRVRRGSRA